MIQQKHKTDVQRTEGGRACKNIQKESHWNYLEVRTQNWQREDFKEDQKQRGYSM